MNDANQSPASAGRLRRPAGLGLLALALLLGLSEPACAAALRSVTVWPRLATLTVAKTRQFTAMAEFSDGTSVDVTANADWTTSSSRVATVRNLATGRGLVTAVGPGTVKVSASVVDEDGSKTKGSADLVVPTPPLQAIRTKPTTKRIEVGLDVQFKAIADRGNDITDDVTTEVTWRSSNPAIATVVAAGSSAGLVHPVAPGTVQIVARDAATGIANTDGSTEVRARVVGLSVEPASIVLARRIRFPMRCYANRADGSRSNVTEDVAWTSNSTSITVGQAAPELGVVRGGGDGGAKIDCTDPVRGLTTAGRSGAAVTVAGRLVGLDLQPAPLVVAKGEARSAKAFGLLAGGGTTGDIAEALAWATSDASVAQVSNDPGDRGQVTGIGKGLATLSAIEPVTGIVSMQDDNVRVPGAVVDLSLDAGEGIVGRDETIALRVVATYEDGWVANVGERCTWSSSRPAVATVTNGPPRGVVAGLLRGDTTVRATCPSGSVSAVVRVPGRAVALRMSPEAVEGEALTTKKLKAIATYEDGSDRDASDSVAWASSAPLVVGLDPESPGSLSLLKTGSATVSAVHPTGPAASAPVAVTPGIIALEIVPGSRTLRASVRARLRAQGRRADGTTKPLTKEVAWISDDERIVRIDARPGEEGSIFGGATKGTTHVRAVLGKGLLDASIPVRVNALLDRIELVPAIRAIPLLDSRIVEAVGHYQDGATKKITRSVVFESSNPAVASVSNDLGRQGVVSGLSPGTALITAVDVSSGKAASNPVPVTVAP